MANSKSAEKRINVNKRNRLQNKYYKTSVRTLIKLFSKKLEPYKISKTSMEKLKLYKILNSISSLLDKGKKKKIFHKKAIVRKHKRLSYQLRKQRKTWTPQWQWIRY